MVWYKDEPQHYVTRNKNEFNNFNLHVVINGKGYLKTKNETYILQQGDSFLYFPSEEQHYFSYKEQPWEVIWVHFSGNYLKDFFIEKGFNLSNVWTLKLWEHVKLSI